MEKKVKARTEKHAKKIKDNINERSEITKATVKVKLGEVNVYKAKEVNIPNVYHPNYKLIDETLEDLKKMSRKVCTLDYAANNVYIILQDALKKVTLAEK